MIRLKSDTADRWLDLSVPTGKDADGKVTYSIVNVKVRPRTSIMDGAASAHAGKKVRAEMEEADASASAGMPLDPAGFNAANTDVLNAKFQQYQVEALAQFGIIEWKGIAGDDGQALPFSADAALAFASVPALANAFSLAYTAPAVLLAEEGNGSSNTSSGDIADTAKPASDATSDQVIPASPDLSAPAVPQP